MLSASCWLFRPFCCWGWLVVLGVAAHYPAFVAYARELCHHLAGVFFGHLEVGDALQQVNVSHLLASAHISVERLHQFARIESVALAQVDEEPAVAFLGFVQAFLAVGLRLFLFLFLLLDWLNLRCVGIVGQESAELHRYDFLDDFFFVYVLEVAVDVGHKGCNLFVVHVGLHYLVHHLVELLLANLLCRGDGLLLE